MTADAVETAICRAFVTSDVPCTWDGNQWEKFVLALCKELARAGGWPVTDTLNH